MPVSRDTRQNGSLWGTDNRAKQIFLNKVYFYKAQLFKFGKKTLLMHDLIYKLFIIFEYNKF